MILKVLVKEDQKAAVDYFKKRDIEEAFKVIERIRRLVVKENSRANLRAEFSRVGLRFEEKISTIEILLLLSKMEIRLVQIRDHLEEEKVKIIKVESDEANIAEVI